MLRWLDHFHSCSVHYCPDMAGTRERSSFACILRVLLPFSFSAVSVFFFFFTPVSFLALFSFFLFLSFLLLVPIYRSLFVVAALTFPNHLAFKLRSTFFLNFPFVTIFVTVCCIITFQIVLLAQVLPVSLSFLCFASTAVDTLGKYV